MLCQETHCQNLLNDTLCALPLALMDGEEMSLCMCRKAKERAKEYECKSLHPSRFSVYKGNLTPASATRHLVFECTQV